jgi:hypothetical protein
MFPIRNTVTLCVAIRTVSETRETRKPLNVSLDRRWWPVHRGTTGRVMTINDESHGNTIIAARFSKGVAYAGLNS